MHCRDRRRAGFGIHATKCCEPSVHSVIYITNVTIVEPGSMARWLVSGVFVGDIFPERYRSGHNGTDSKSVGGFAAPRGFESLPLRQINMLCTATVLLP